MRRLIRRLRFLLDSRRADADLAEEIEFHRKQVELEIAGDTNDGAAAASHRRMGNVTMAREDARGVWIWPWIETLAQDVRFAARMLRKNPGFSAVAIITLALGIGANTTIFSVVNALVFRPLRIADPDRVVFIREAHRKQPSRRNPTAASYDEWRRGNRTLEEIGRAEFGGVPAALVGLGRAERVMLDACTPEFLPMLGVRAFRGRTFVPDDIPDALGEGVSVVLSHSYWTRSFAGDAAVLGKQVSIEGMSKTVVGVLPPEFSILPWKMNVDVWLAFNPGRNPRSRWLSTVGRLKPGVSIDQAEADLNAIASQSASDADRDWRVEIIPLHEAVVGSSRGFFNVLLGAVGFVLLIACANVGNLLLARATARKQEMAIRTSLGAGRYRLIRQLLAESLMLAALGGALAVVVGLWGTRVLLALRPFGFDATEINLVVDARVLGFTAGIALLTGVLFGLVPAFRASQADLTESLKEGGRNSEGRPRQRGRQLLLVSEVALAVVLLMGAGLMINSFLRMRNVELGFNPGNVLRADVFLSGPTYWQPLPDDIKRVTPQGVVFFDRVLERIAAIPGVRHAAIIHLAPPSGVPMRELKILDRPTPETGQDQAGYVEASPGIFPTLQIPLLKGRYLSENDVLESPWVVVINQTLARHFFQDENPLGKRVQLALGSASSGHSSAQEQPREIVGVVGDVRHSGFFASTSTPLMYGSFRQRVTDYPGGTYSGHLWKSITVRTASDPTRFTTAVQKAVAEVDKTQPVFNIRSLESGLEESLSSRRFTAQLFGVFGGLALFLAAVGIYGVMSYLVSRRMHEMGLRIALGATPGNVRRLVVGNGLRITLVGLVLGFAASFALTRLISGYLYEVTPTDPLTHGIVALLLTGVAAAACYTPARRATKVDPLIALRHD